MSFSLTVRPFDVRAVDAPLLAIALPRLTGLPDALRPLDALLGGTLERSIAERDFTGRRDETLHLSGAREGARRVLLVGMGEPKLEGPALKRAASIAARSAAKFGLPSMAFAAPTSSTAALEQAAAGLYAGAWRYDDLMSPPPEDERRPRLDAAVILSDDGDAEDAVRRGAAFGEGQSLARRLQMMPGNLCTPDFLADTAREMAQRHGLEVNVLGRAEMEREEMGAFLCVAQGTPQEPKLVTLGYKGYNGGEGKPIVLVGKGLCFDTGGISIKPAAGMEAMKFDMSGAAGVLGAMEAIARLKLPVNVVGIIGATTNMPSGTAVKPGDVVRASSGKTIEVINTDAEGRLVLADLLAYARRFEPAVVLDAATLTGAIVIALGHTAIGVFGPDQALVDEVIEAGRRAGEPGWPLPVWDEYRDLIKSDVADVKNTGGRPAGSITAALFLKEFATDYPWVHLDIAGTANSESDLVAMPKGPTGIPVTLFVEFVRGRAG